MRLVAMAPSAVPTNEANNVKGQAAATETRRRHKLYILSEFHPEAVKHAQSLFDCVLHTDPEAERWRSHATAILVKDYYIGKEDLDAAPQLRVIGKQGVGLDKIDAEACAARHVRICNTPGVNASAVAEMTLGLALGVARSIPALTRRQVADGEVIRKETCNGILLGGKTVGIIGMGAIGRAVGTMFKRGLNCHLLTYDSYFPPPGGPWEQIPHRRTADLDELLERSDIVTVHVPLNNSTRGLISYREMCRMKPTAILLNTARGAIVDEDDLVRALEEQEIWGAGFDCHVQEPPTKEKYQRLWSHPRFVGTPHVAAATDETQIATTNAAIDGVLAFLNHQGSRITL